MARISLTVLRRYLMSGSVANISSSFVSSSYTSGTISACSQSNTLFTSPIFYTCSGTYNATGSTIADATVLDYGPSTYLCTTTSASFGVKLDEPHIFLGSTISVVNMSSASFFVYPTTSGTIGSASAQAGVPLLPGNHYALLCYQTGSTPKWSISGK